MEKEVLHIVIVTVSSDLVKKVALRLCGRKYKKKYAKKAFGFQWLLKYSPEHNGDDLPAIQLLKWENFLK